MDCVDRRDRDTLIVGVTIILLCAILYVRPIMEGSSKLSMAKFTVTEDPREPIDFSVIGRIVDNYANVTYQMTFDNTASETATEVEWFFGLQDGLRLRNISVLLGDATYWGRVLPEQQAIETYNESVQANKSAVLVQRVYQGYSISFNVESATEALLSVYVEGFLTREKGLYSLNLPIGRTGIENTAFLFDLTLLSNFELVSGYSVEGLPSLTVSDLSNGIRLEYTSPSLTIEEHIRITYALERQIGGAQLLTYNNGSENFFVYMLAPSITEVLESAPKQYVFVLDRSGSMSGTKMEQAKIAFSSMIGSMLSYDLFNVISFSSDISSLWTEPHSATASNIQAAQNWVQAISASGSTNFHGAAMEGLDTFNEGDNVKAMLILSDGLPTAGTITDTPGILSAINEANPLGVSISTVAFGSDSDENLMANIATQNDGFFVFIEPSEDASTELLEFYQAFSTPIADSYEIGFTGASEVTAILPLAESPFFNGSEVIVTGRYEESMTVTTTIDYVTGTETYADTVGSSTTSLSHVEYIWAQQRITYLLQEVALHGNLEIYRDQIVALGMQYGITVGGYTAMVLTTYDVDSSVEEGTLDGSSGTYRAPAVPTSSPGTYAAVTAAPSAAPALDPVLFGGTFPIVVIGVIVIVLLISRFRRG